MAETKSENDGASLLDAAVVIIGILLITPMAGAAIFGFIGRALYYGFVVGMEEFDDFFETEASKSRKSK